MKSIILVVIIGAFLLCSGVLSFAESANLLRTTTETEEGTQVTIPAGAMASISPSTNNGSAGGVTGFQIWRRDEFYLSALASLAGTQTISGHQKNFGAFLLNPSIAGASFYGSFNYLFKISDEVLLGPAGRFGATRVDWNANVSVGDTTVSGWVLFGNFGPQICSATSAIPLFGTNTIIIGAEMDFAFRILAGDLGQSSAKNFLRDSNVLGTSQKEFCGVELSLFFIVNELKFTFRYSYFFANDEISGLTGSQAFIGAEVQTTALKLKE